MLQMIWLANKITAVSHKLNLSLTFGFEVQTSADECCFGSGKHVFFQHDNYETKTLKLVVETFQTAELSLNSCFYGSKRITRTGDNVGKTELLPLRAPERMSEQAFNWSLEGWAL